MFAHKPNILSELQKFSICGYRSCSIVFLKGPRQCNQPNYLFCKYISKCSILYRRQSADRILVSQKNVKLCWGRTNCSASSHRCRLRKINYKHLKTDTANAWF